MIGCKVSYAESAYGFTKEIWHEVTINIISIKSVSDCDYDNLHEWLIANIVGNWTVLWKTDENLTPTRVHYFQEESDATLVKLTWL